MQHVIQHRQRFEQTDVLEGARDARRGDAIRAHAGDAAPLQNDAALRGGIYAGDHVESGGLARAVRADERDDLLTVDVHAQVVDGDKAAKTHGGVGDFQYALIHVRSPPCRGR